MKAVPEDLVDHYERIAKRHGGGIALAEIRSKRSCGQCGVHIRPHVIQQLQRENNEGFSLRDLHADLVLRRLSPASPPLCIYATPSAGEPPTTPAP